MTNSFPALVTEEEDTSFESPPKGMEPIPATKEEIEMFSGAPPEWMKPVPISNEDILYLIDGKQDYYPNLKEFEIYRKAKKDEEGEDLLSIAGEGFSTILSEIWEGLKSSASHGFYLGRPGLALKTAASGYIRGSTDVFMLMEDIFTKDFHASDTYEDYLNETGKPDNKDNKTDYYKTLRKDLQNFTFKKSMIHQRQLMREGKANAYLPFYGEIEGEDVKGAELAGYAADWTMAIPVVGWGGKAVTKTASGIARAGGKVTSVAGGFGKGLMTKAGEAVAENIPGGAATIPLANRVAGGVGVATATGNPWITAASIMPEAARTAEIVGGITEQIGKQMSKGPSQFGVLERVAMSKTTDPKIRRLAKLLSAGGVGDKLLSGTGRVAVGTGTSMALGAGLGGLAQGWEGAAQGLGAGAAIGGPATLATIGGMKISGAERRARETGDIMKFLADQTEMGLDPKEALLKLGRDTLLKTATLKEIFQGSVNVRILNKAQWKDKTVTGKDLRGAAAAWDSETSTIWLNMDKAGAKENVLHEFGHALFDSGIVNKNDIHTELQSIYGETRIQQMKTQYLDKLVDGKKKAEFEEKYKDPKEAKQKYDEWKYSLDESVPPTLTGEPGRSLSSEYINSRNAEEQKLIKSKNAGMDWYISEIFADEFVGATLDRNINQLRKGNIPIQDREFFGLKGAFLNTKASIFRRMGVPIDANGRVDKGYASRIFGEMSGDRKFKQSLRNYIKDRAKHLDSKNKRASKDDPGVKLNLRDMGDHPAAGWRSRGDGSFETDIAIKTKSGMIIAKDPETIARTYVLRAEEFQKIRENLVLKGAVDKSNNKAFGLRYDIDGKERVSGTILPEEVLNMAALPESVKDYLRNLQEMVHTGQTVIVDYAGISTTRRGNMSEVIKYKTNAKGEKVSPDLRGSTKWWRKVLNSKKGNIKASHREVKPLGFTLTKEGNLTMQVLDMDFVQSKSERWLKDTNSLGEKKLSLWRNDLGDFYDDMATYLSNYKEGKSGSESIGEAKRDVFRAFFMQLHKSGGVSPVDKIYNNRPLDRKSGIKDFRADRIGHINPTYRDDFYFDYEAKRWNLMPDGTTRVREHGQQIKINEAMVNRFMPAPDGAKYIDIRDLSGEGPIALSLDRLGNGVRSLMSGAKTEIEAQGGRSFMWLEGKWASYEPTPLVQLVNALKSAGTEYVALSMLGELNHNKTRYGMRVFAESVIDAVNRGEMTMKKADAYVAAMTDFSAGRKINVSGKMKPFETSFPEQHKKLRQVKSLEELIHYIDTGDLTHKAGEVIADTRSLKTGKPIDKEGKFYKKHGKAIVTQEAAEAMGFGPQATAKLAVDQGLWDEKKYPIGTVVAIMKVKHDAKVSHEPNLHYHYPHTIDVEPIGYLPEFYELKSLSRGLSRKTPEPGKKRGTVYSDTGAVSPNPLMQIKPELDLLKEGNIGDPIPHQPMFMPDAPRVDSMNMHSRVEEVTIGNKVPNKGTGDQMLATIKKQPGIKQDELDWLGLEDFLAGKGKEKVTKEEILQYIKENDIELEEVTYRGDPDFEISLFEDRFNEDVNGDINLAVRDEVSLKEFEINAFHDDRSVYIQDDKGSFVYEGKAENPNTPMREVIEFAKLKLEDHLREEAGTRAEQPTTYHDYTLPDYIEGSNREILFRLPRQSQSEVYKDMHWKENNVLAHTRLNERKGKDGEKILFVEEIQSDWHNEGRKYGYVDEAKFEIERNQIQTEINKLAKEMANYRVSQNLDPSPHSGHHKYLLDNHPNHPEYTKLNNAHELAEKKYSEVGNKSVPDAPLKNSWHELVLKRILGIAANGKFDKVAWINGGESAKRYDLSHHVEKIDVLEEGGGTYEIMVKEIGDDAHRTLKTGVPENELQSYIGKELAVKAMDNMEDGAAYLDNTDIKIGGEWAVNLYDKMIPQFLKKYGKKFGTKIDEIDIGRSDTPVIRKAESRIEYGRLISPTYYFDDFLGSSGKPSRYHFKSRTEAEQAVRNTKIFQSIDVTSKMNESHARFMPEEFKGSTDPVMGMARRNQVTGKNWDDVVDRRKPVVISPVPTKHDLLSDKGLLLEDANRVAENFKKGMKPIKTSLQLLNRNQRKLIGAIRETPDGTRVGVRQDIPFRRKTKEWFEQGKIDQVSSAWAIHDPRSPNKGPMAFDTIVRLENVEMFIKQSQGNRDIENIAAGKVGKFPLATLEGDLVQVYNNKGNLKKDALPSPEELGDPNKWIEIGMDPHRHEYFYRKDNHRVPIESASEAIIAGDAAYVKKDDRLVEGDRNQFRYFPAETASIEARYTEALQSMDLDKVQNVVDRAAAAAGRSYTGNAPVAYSKGKALSLHDRYDLEPDDVKYMPAPAVVSQDGNVRTLPTKGRVVRTGSNKFRVYGLNGKLIGVASSQATADALLNRGK